MPLLGKKLYKPNPLPKDLRTEEEVFVIKETNEVFRSYEEYVNRIILYGFQVWSCQYTGKTNLKYGEAVMCEEQALKKLESFPKYFEKPVLWIVHHSSSGLQTLAQQCCEHLEKEFVENEPVDCCVGGKWYQGMISRVHHGSDPENIPSTSSSPSSDKENSKVDKQGSVLEKNTEVRYDISCESIPGGIKDVVRADIKRLKKLPSVEMLKCFIRASTENPWTNDNSPWQVKTDLAKKYSLTDKLSDFSLVFNKKTTPSSKAPPKGTKSSEKRKKKLQDESTSHGKSKGNKVDPSQRKLDSFRKSIGNTSKTIDRNTSSSPNASSTKLSLHSLENHSPVVKDLIEVCSSSEKDDGKTPSGELRGTPVKCRLVLTPVKSPYRGTGKRPTHTTPTRTMSAVKESRKTKPDVTAVINTDDITIISCKSPKENLPQSGKKLKKSPKSGKSKKSLEGIETEAVKKKTSKSQDFGVTYGQFKEKEIDIKTAQSEKKAKEQNPDAVVKRADIVDLADDSDNEFVSFPKKLKVSLTPVKVNKSSAKMRQTTLLDLTKKPEDEKTLLSSPKIKAKKQKTLAEMFSAALQKDKPKVLNALIRKTAQEVSSPSSLALNLSTPQRDLVAEKWNAHKERLKWKELSIEEKAKFALEKRKLQRQLNGKIGDKQKQEDSKLVNLKPLPPAKPMNIPSGITAESYSDVVMIAEFVHTFRDLLAPKETLHISIDNLSKALVADVKGFHVLSRILVIFLQILLQDSSTKGQELGMQLSEMPLTRQSASEVARLYLNSKLKMLTAYTEDKQLQEILEALQHQELYNLNPEEKIKILVVLCHEVLSSDALDEYMGSQLAEATELRKEKMAKLKEKKDQQKEEKERLKKEKEELQKTKEEEESKKQLKMDDLTKKDETESTCTSAEAITANQAPENSTKTDEQKAVKEVMKNQSSKKVNEEVSEVVITMRKRREEMANKQEKKLKEEKERLEKEEEEQWNINMAHCQYTKRLVPIGHDRNHSRYWVFSGIAGGVYVEQGWRNLEDLSQTSNEGSKEVVVDKEATMETDSNEQAPLNDDLELIEETKDESKMDADKDDEIQELRLPDVPYSWSCYDTIEEVQALLECLSQQGIRESALRKSLKEQMEAITDGIKRNACKKPTKPETDEEELFNSIKEELKETAERLVHGNLAILGDGLEEYKQSVDQASSVTDLASQLEKLLPSVLPQFYQGMFSKDKTGSDQAKQCWVKEVKKATTVSRLHLLLGILDSMVIWDLSAENARCKICRSKGIGKTLMLCDDCNLAFHLQCLRPALSEVPEGHWSCPLCKPNERQSGRSSAKNYKEMSSSEAGDEGDEASEASLGDSEESSSEDETDEHEDYCHTCGEDGDLICCDTCPLVFHTDCHQPPLRHIPRGAWSCWQCRQPKNKKQKKELQGSHTSKSKAARNKAEKRTRRDEGPQRKSKRRRSCSPSSDESGYEKGSKRTRQRRQPKEISNDRNARGTRRRARASIEDMSDDDSTVGKTKSSKRNQRGSVLTRLQRRYPQDSENEEEESLQTNVKSFYGRSTRRTRQQKVSKDDDDSDDGEEEPVTQSKNSARNPERRRNRPQIMDDSEDEDEDNETEEKENRKASQRKNSSRSKVTENPARRSMRNQRRVSSSSEESDNDDEDTVQTTNLRASRNKTNGSSKQVSSSSYESAHSGRNASKGSASKRQARINKCPETNKTRKSTMRGEAQRRRGNKESIEDESDDGEDESSHKKSAKEGKQKKGGLKNSSSTNDGRKQARNGKRTDVSQEDTKEKRRRANVEMDACEQIIRDLLLHKDSWPFAKAVNLREVPDYLELIKNPMDLGTIRDKLKNLEYPDVDSFVADVRLVFSNSDKYNLDTSEVGKAGKNLEKYFDKLFKQNFSNSDKKSKVQRKR